MTDPTYCASGCDAPAIGRIGNEWLCAACLDSLESAPLVLGGQGRSAASLRSDIGFLGWAAIALIILSAILALI